MRGAAVDLVTFGKNRFIVKTIRGVVWSEVLLLGTSVVGFYTEKRQLEKTHSKVLWR